MKRTLNCKRTLTICMISGADIKMIELGLILSAIALTALIGRLKLSDVRQQAYRDGFQNGVLWVLKQERYHVVKANHASDCLTNNAPALPVGPCNCGADYMNDLLKKLAP